MAKKKRKPVHKENKEKRAHFGRMPNEDARVQQAKLYFKKNKQVARENKNIDKVMFEGLDYDHDRQKRRIEAIFNTLPMVKELVSEVVEEYPEVFTVDTDWIELNTYPTPGYDLTERCNHAAYGAALWMLDQVKNAGKMQYLNSEVGVEPEGKLPPAPSICDPCHGHEILQVMVKGIYTRNGNVKLYDENRKNQLIRLYMDSGLAADTIDRSAEPCSFYQQVLALIPKQAIDEAVTHYERVFWDWVKRYYQTRNLYAQYELRVYNQLNALEQEEIEAFKNTVGMAGLALMLTTCADEKDIPNLYARFPVLENGHRHLATIKNDTMSLAQRKKNLEQKKDKAIRDVQMFWYHLGYLPLWNDEDRVETFGPEGAEIWKDFDTGDPYEMAFAFIYLLDNGSDLPWCYFPGTSVHNASAAKLPWSRMGFSPMHVGFFHHHDPETGETKHGPAEYSLPRRTKVPELEDWYSLRYSDREDVNPELFNLSQIIYGITGCIMPRKLDRYHPALKTLERYGISGKQMTHVLIYCMTLMGELRNRTDVTVSQLEIIDEEDARLRQEGAENVKTLQKQVAVLKDELKQQKQLAYESSREARELRQRYESLTKVSANDVQELHDLRELIFRQQEGSYESVQPSDDISFPYSTDSRIIVFGGYESWVREIKRRLPTVRFVDKSAIPNANMIRYADAIWIQTNAMCHSHFHKIVDEAKKSRIPIRYFSFSSPIKCAEQLAQEDKKTAK